MNQPQKYFLIWPDWCPRKSAAVDFGLRERHFIFIRPNEPRTWDNLKALRRGTKVLVPYGVWERGLLDIINARPVDRIEGLDACRQYLTAAGEGGAS